MESCHAEARIRQLEDENQRLRAELKTYKDQHTRNQKTYNEKNKEAINKQKREYYQENRDKIRKKQNEHYRSKHPNVRSDCHGNADANVVQTRDISMYL